MNSAMNMFIKKTRFGVCVERMGFRKHKSETAEPQNREMEHYKYEIIIK